MKEKICAHVNFINLAKFRMFVKHWEFCAFRLIYINNILQGQTNGQAVNISKVPVKTKRISKKNCYKVTIVTDFTSI